MFKQYPWRTSSPIRSRLGFRYTQGISAIALPIQSGGPVLGSLNLIFFLTSMTPEVAARRYPYKRSHLIALRRAKISASDPPSVWWPGDR